MGWTTCDASTNLMFGTIRGGRSLRQGIELPEPTWQELVAIAAELNVTILDA